MLPLLVTDPSDYLASDAIVDHEHAEVSRQAAMLRTGRPDDVNFARAAFEFVRDEIRHSWDAQDSRVTLCASDTLREGVGLCFSKSHLLVGLLRAEGVPAGLCYQRLTDDGNRFDVHGLLAVHLEGAWHRQDPRGNKPGVNAQFSLTEERLAWPIRPRLGECDYIDVLRGSDAPPLRPVWRALVACRRSSQSYRARWSRRAPSSSRMSSAETDPRRPRTRATSMDRTCSACAFESIVSPVESAGSPRWPDLTNAVHWVVDDTCWDYRSAKESVGTLLVDEGEAIAVGEVVALVVEISERQGAASW